MTTQNKKDEVLKVIEKIKSGMLKNGFTSAYLYSVKLYYEIPLLDFKKDVDEINKLYDHFCKNNGT